MRTKTVIFILLSAFMFMMAAPGMPLSGHAHGGGATNTDTTARDTAAPDTAIPDTFSTDTAAPDSTAETDTTQMDSLELAIYRHNRHVDDSIRMDSINRKKSNGLDAPVTFSSDDSLVYYAATKHANLYGNSNVKYQNMDLKSDRIQMSLDSSLVHATGTADTAGKLTGKPVFVMGQDTYESDTM